LLQSTEQQCTNVVIILGEQEQKLSWS